MYSDFLTSPSRHETHLRWKPVDSGHTPKFDYTMESTNLVLNTLQNIGSMAPVPLLGEAASVVARIISIIQDVKDRNQAFQDLVSDAYGLVCTISLECNNIIDQGQRLPENLESHLSSLVSNLREIEKFSLDKVKRGMMKRIIYHTKDLEQINRYRTLLRQSLDVFGLQSTISIQQNLQVILTEVRTQASNYEKDKQKQELERLRAEGDRLTTKLEHLRLLKEQELEKRRRVAEKVAVAQEEKLNTPAPVKKTKKPTTKVQVKQEDMLNVEPRHRRSKSTQGFREKTSENVTHSSTPGITIQPPSYFSAQHSAPYSAPYSSPYSSPYLSPYPGQYAPPSSVQYPQFSGGLSPYPYSHPQASVSLNDIVGSALSLAGSVRNMSWNTNSGNVFNTVVNNVSNDYSRR